MALKHQHRIEMRSEVLLYSSCLQNNIANIPSSTGVTALAALTLKNLKLGVCVCLCFCFSRYLNWLFKAALTGKVRLFWLSCCMTSGPPPAECDRNRRETHTQTQSGPVSVLCISGSTVPATLYGRRGNSKNSMAFSYRIMFPRGTVQLVEADAGRPQFIDKIVNIKFHRNAIAFSTVCAVLY